MRLTFLVLIITIGLSTNISGQIQLAKIFSDNMMLQADSPIPIWGKAQANSKIEVFLDDKCIKGNVDQEGNWKVVLPPNLAGHKASIVVKNDSHEISLSNIVYGDVWLCGGQSNMEWYVEGSDNAEEEIKNANYQDIRIFDVPRTLAPFPARDLTGGHWEVSSSKSIPQFSAVGYYFGRALHASLDRPIGLIGDNYGGTIAESWTSEQSLNDYPVFAKMITEFKETNMDEAKKTGDTAFNKWLSLFHTEDKGIQDSIHQWANVDERSWNEMQLPALWDASTDTTLLDKDGVLWFSKTFVIDNPTNATLSLGPIDDTDITWINGHKVGETYNQYNKDRTYEVSKDVLHVGENRITIRVEDYIGGGGIYGKAEKMYLELSDQKIKLSGKWKYKKGMTASTKMPSNSFSPNNFPTCLYNGMIAPITDFPIKGVIWYQGESNSYRAYEYQTLFPKLINDWRLQWNQPELPFIFVQLANFKNEQVTPEKSEWAELREAQSMALSLTNTAMITAIDIGDAANIHPTNKQEIGRRLANAALTEVYDKTNPYKGPTYSNYKTDGASILIAFDHVGDGLQVNNKFGYVKGFTIAGDDRKYKWAKAEIINKNQVRVWNNDISNPISVRYSWQDNPAPANLKNNHLLPAFPFRTDDYMISTFEINRL